MVSCAPIVNRCNRAQPGPLHYNLGSQCLERHVVAETMLAGAIGCPAEVEIGPSVLRALVKANGTIHQFSQPGGQLGEPRYLQAALLQIFSEVPRKSTRLNSSHRCI